MELDFDVVIFICVDFFVFGVDDGGCLQFIDFWFDVVEVVVGMLRNEFVDIGDMVFVVRLGVVFDVVIVVGIVMCFDDEEFVFFLVVVVEVVGEMELVIG